jgi:hypothetical protein
MNIISYGKEMDERSLQLVYMIEWDVRDVEEGTTEQEDRKTRLGNANLLLFSNLDSRAWHLR